MKASREMELEKNRITN